MSEYRLMRVEDVMSTNLHVIKGLDTVKDAVLIMRQQGVNSLVVERRDGNDEAGLLLLSDIATQVLAQNRAPERVNVYEVMTKPALTLPPGMSVRNALALLTRLELSRALVVDADRNPVGLVTLRDLALGEDPED